MNRSKLCCITLSLVFSMFILSGCHNNNNKNTSQENTTETVAEPTTETSEIPAVTPPNETTEKTTLTTEPETVTESETTRETTMAAEDVTWLEKLMGKLFKKEPDEITEEDYLAIEHISIDIDNLDNIDDLDFKKSKNRMSIGTESGKGFTYYFDQSEKTLTSIDINDIIKCKNIEWLSIYFAADPKPDVYIHNYESLAELQKMHSLKININATTYEDGNIYGVQTSDQITDISFVEKMPNLISIEFQNIDLPDDLSPLFTGSLESIILRGCGITDDAFQNLGDNPSHLDTLILDYNEISDASVLTAMQKADGSQLPRLSLRYNPLTNLGDFLSFEEVEYPGYPAFMYLDLGETIFEEYSWEIDPV